MKVAPVLAAPAALSRAAEFAGEATSPQYAERLDCTSANDPSERITFVADVAAIPVVSADDCIACTACCGWNGHAIRRAEVWTEFFGLLYKTEVSRMNAIGTRMMLALLGGLLWAMPAKSANEMRFSDIEARLAAVEQKTSAIPGLKSAAFLSDGDAIDAIAPNESIHAENEDEEISSPAPFQGASAASSHGFGRGSACECGNACDCGACECGDACDCGSDCECGQSRDFGCASGCGCGCENNGMANGSYYADVELMFLRPHLSVPVA
jgi:hypothetical protein